MVVSAASVHVGADHIGQRLGDVLQHLHAGQLLLDGPVRIDAVAELCAGGGVVGGPLDTGLHGAR